MKLNYECFKNLNSVTIFDCFDYSSQIQTLQGVDAIPCDNCRISNNISLHQTVIYSPPEILIGFLSFSFSIPTVLRAFVTSSLLLFAGTARAISGISTFS